MSEADPTRPAYNMKKYRRALRLAFRTMQLQYRDGIERPYLLPEIRWGMERNETEKRWPDILDFEIKASRKREDRL